MSGWTRNAALLLLVLSLPGPSQPQEVLGPVLGTRERMPYLVVACGDAGQACCKPPRPIEGTADLGPLVNCKAGLGCDLTTNTCVSPCGAVGQACCDGPETRAPRWTPGLRIFVPAGALTREMCDAAYCDRQDRRCKADCGQQEGQACCPPQPGVGVGTCLVSTLVCDQASNSFAPHGTCRACGRLGQPACADGCSDRSIEQNGLCAPCGYPGMPVCSADPPCDAGAAPHPEHGITCVPAGWDGQPCLPGRLCHGGNQCDTEDMCRACGAPGQPCCQLPGVPPCSPGECEQGMCKACGYFDQPVCAGSLCSQGIPHGDFCRACGGEGQPCCRGFVELCRNNMQCQDDACRIPGSGGPVEGPRTCGGEPYTFSTRQIRVFIEDENSCGSGLDFFANTPEEALQCARNLVGDRVIGLNASMYQVYLSCPASGCLSQQYLARDQESAESCAEFSQPNCEIADQACD